MKKISVSWVTVLAVVFTGLSLQADEKKDDDGNKPAAEDGKGKGKGGKGKGKGGGPDLSKLFDLLDKNEDGSLSLRELSEARPFKDASKREVAAAFKEKDLNDDGEIGRGEFAKTFGKNRPKGKGKGKGKKR